MVRFTRWQYSYNSSYVTLSVLTLYARMTYSAFIRNKLIQLFPFHLISCKPTKQLKEGTTRDRIEVKVSRKKCAKRGNLRRMFG